MRAVVCDGHGVLCDGHGVCVTGMCVMGMVLWQVAHTLARLASTKDEDHLHPCHDESIGCYEGKEGLIETWDKHQRDIERMIVE